MRIFEGLSKFRQTTTKLRYSAIGIEFGQEEINLVQLRADDEKTIELCTFASIEYPVERDLFLDSFSKIKAHILPVLKEKGFHGRRIVTVLPSNHLKIMSLSYHVKPGQSHDHAIAHLVEDRVEGSINDYVVDYLPVRKSESTQNHLAVVAVSRREYVVKFLDNLRRAGLSVDALDIGPAAIKRLVSVMHEQKEGEIVLAINLGYQFSYLSMISGRRLLFDDEVRFGEAELVQKVADELQLEPSMARAQLYLHGLGQDVGAGNKGGNIDEQISITLLEILRPSFVKLAEHVRRAQTFAASEARGETVKSVYLVGGVARWRGAQKLMAGLLDMPVHVIPDPLATFKRNGSSEEPVVGCAELAVATGLALRGIV